MINNIISFYKIGKELGLTKREINRILLFDKSKNSKLYNVLFFIVLFLLLIFFVYSVITVKIYVSQNTYARGTFYSTIRIKDFQEKS